VAAAAITSVGYVSRDTSHRALLNWRSLKKTEPPKIEQRAGISPPKAVLRRWRLGYQWTYQVSGIAKGRT